MQRIVIVGASGSGKSTLAERLAERLSLTSIDLDELFHGPEWAPTPTPEFRGKVADALDAAGETGWVIAGNYPVVSDITNGRADTIVWLDLPRWLCVARVARRSLGRVVLRRQLWNGNREKLSDVISRDPQRSVVVHAWHSQPLLRARYEGFANGPFWAHADVRRPRTSRAVRALLASVTAA